MEGEERLSPAERRLLECATRGTLLDLTGHDQVISGDVLTDAVMGQLSDQPPRAIRLKGAVIEGTLALSGVTVDIPLTFDRCTFTRPPELRDASLLSLDLRGSRIPGLRGDGLRVRGSLRMSNGFVSTKGIKLVGADIAGTIFLNDARLSKGRAKDGRALSASRMRLGGHFFAQDAVIDGQLRLISARIGGLLNLRRTKLSRPGADCLQGERFEIGESLWLNDAQVRGRVALAGARVGGGVDFKGARFTDPEVLSERSVMAGLPVSLRTSRMKVGANLICGYGFQADGAIWLDSTEVGGVLSFREAGEMGGDHPINLSATSAQSLDLRFRTPPAGGLNLRNARTSVLIDDIGTWPGFVDLDGMAYERLQPATDIPVQKRIDWLRRSGKGYRPQPYEQLAVAYRNAGLEQEARRVSYAKLRARRPHLPFPGRVWDAVMQWTVGYGYRNWRAGYWLAGLIALGWFLFAHGHPVATSDRPAPFHSFVYAADLLLPIASLGQESAWRFASWLRWLSFAYILAGWLLTTAVVAGVTRAFNAK